MPNELNISLGQAKQVVLARIYIAGAQVGEDIPLSEVSNQGGYYTGNMTNVGAALYDVQFFVNGTLRGSGNIAWNGTREVSVLDQPTAIQIRQELDSNSAKLANLDATITSRLAADEYVMPPTADSIAAATAGMMFVDGSDNPLKVNPDHSVLFGGGPVTIANYVTIPAPVAVASQAPSTITCLRGDTLRVSLPLLGSVALRTKLVMTAKISANNSDDEAVLQVVEGVGLTRLNGSVVASATTASLIVADATTGVANLEIDASVTAELAVTDLIWDVQVISSSGISSPISGAFSVTADVTRAVN